MKPKLPLGIIGLAFTVLFGYHTIQKWQRQQVRLIQQQIAQEQDTQQAQADLAALVRDVAEYRTRLPKEPTASWLVHEVVAIGQKAGVQFTTVNEEAPQRFPQFTRLGVNLQCKTSYHQLGTLLDYLERSEHFIRTDRITVSSSGDEGLASIELALSTLYLPPLPEHSGK